MVIKFISPRDLMDSLKVLLESIAEDLQDAEIRAQYEAGSKDPDIKDWFSPLLESTNSMLIDRYGKSQAIRDDYESIWQDLYFFSDMYFELVVSVLRLADIRDNDISAPAEFGQLLNQVVTELQSMVDIQPLDRLRADLKARVRLYPEKPVLQAFVLNMLRLKNGLYVMEPPRLLADYNTDDVIATISPEVNVTGAAITGLPGGVEVDPVNGEIRVSNTAELHAGIYELNVTTTDETNGQTRFVLELQIGDRPSAEYKVYEGKRVQNYSDDDLLAVVRAGDAEIESAVLLDGTLPAGSILDGANGDIKVYKAALLESGESPVVIRTRDSLGRVTEHEVKLFILPDTPAVYTINPPKPLSKYRDKDLLAIPLDADGGIVAAGVSNLPNGMVLDPDSGVITVSDPAALIPGIYTLNITVTEAFGTVSTNQVEIIIGGTADAAAIYTLAPVKALADYANADLIASVTDSDAPIVFADFVGGQLPPGTSLHRFNGNVVVTDKRWLIPGKYDVKLVTTDARGGVTRHELTIQIADEALYTVLHARMYTEYADDDLLAFAVSPGGDISAATVTSGSLPDGTVLASNGDITIEDSTQVVPGTWTFDVQTTDSTGVGSTNTLTIRFLGDQEATYIIAPPRNVKTYKRDEVIAYPVDPDGRIVRARQISGELPRALKLEEKTGNIFVVDPSHLSAGKYENIGIETRDEKGGLTFHVITLEFVEDFEAEYTVFPAKPLNLYQDGEGLAVVLDPDGAIVGAKVVSGMLPSGTKMDTVSGTISVGDAAKLVKGDYELSIYTRDILGGDSTNTIVLSILEATDVDAEYIVSAPQNVDSLETGDVIAYAVDPNGAITSAALSNGTLPPGIGLNSTAGVISVTDPSVLVAGKTLVQITTTDVLGGNSELDVLFEILPDSEAEYVMAPVKKFDKYVDGDIIGSVLDADGALVSATITAGALPDGMGFNTVSGEVTVTDAAVIVAGIWDLTVDTVDVTGGKSSIPLHVVIENDSPAVYDVEPGRNVFSYRNGDILATVTDLDGAIVSAVLLSGALPSGVALDSTDGTITVSNRDLLVPGTYLLQIRTTDELSGVTDSSVSLVFRGRATERRVIIKKTPERLKELEHFNSDVLTTEQVVNRTIYDLTSIVYEKVDTGLDGGATEQLYVTGQKDAQIRSDFNSVTVPVKERILTHKAETDTLTGDDLVVAQANLSFHTALYSETVVSLIDLIALRTGDIPANPSEDINQLLDILASQAGELSALTELDFMRTNLTEVRDGITGKPKLITKINNILNA